MRATLLAALVVLGSPAAAFAQPSSTTEAHESEARPVVLVIDPGPLRISAERLSRAVSRALARDIVRLTDPRASGALHVLTIAYDAERRWYVRLDAQGKTVTMIERAVPPGAIDSHLADTCRRAMMELETTQDAPAALPVTPPSSDPIRGMAQRSGYFVWAQEILDPFVDVPRPTRHEIAIFSEVIDPFAPAAARRSAFTEVLDPWGY
jgi:hypothetical protein